MDELKPDASSTQIENIDELPIEEIKEIRRAKERKNLLRAVASGSCNTLTEKIAFLLRDDMDSRNSDLELAWQYWRAYEADILGDDCIGYEKSFKLTRLTSIARARAKIQNEHKLFQADEIIRKHRGTLEEDFKARMIEETASYPFYSAYIDETGKTDKNLIVGGAWLLERRATLKGLSTIAAWKSSKAIDFEFHFAEMSRNKLDVYKEFAEVFVNSNSMLSFHAVIHPRHGIGNVQSAIEELTFQSIVKAIYQLHESGKATLPRRIQVWLDDEEENSDKLKLESIKSRLKAEDFSKFGDLKLDEFQVVSSSGNNFIQVADLFISSLNRITNYDLPQRNHKDEFVEFFLKMLGWNGVRGESAEFAGDLVTIHRI